MVQDFKRQNFKPFTIGIQIRRLKCDGHEGSINCLTLPAVENYVSVARSLQYARGLDDSDVRFFVGADEPETYVKACPRPGSLSKPCICIHMLTVAFLKVSP